MEKEKTLSEKIMKEGKNTWGYKKGWLDVEDVKEAVKKLIWHGRYHCNECKAYTCDNPEHDKEIRVSIKEIKEIVGDKLI